MAKYIIDAKSCYESAVTDCKPGTGEKLAGMLMQMLEWIRQWRK